MLYSKRGQCSLSLFLISAVMKIAIVLLVFAWVANTVTLLDMETFEVKNEGVLWNTVFNIAKSNTLQAHHIRRRKATNNFILSEIQLQQRKDVLVSSTRSSLPSIQACQPPHLQTTFPNGVVHWKWPPDGLFSSSCVCTNLRLHVILLSGAAAGYQVYTKDDLPCRSGLFHLTNLYPKQSYKVSMDTRSDIGIYSNTTTNIFVTNSDSRSHGDEAFISSVWSPIEIILFLLVLLLWFIAVFAFVQKLENLRVVQPTDIIRRTAPKNINKVKVVSTEKNAVIYNQYGKRMSTCMEFREKRLNQLHSVSDSTESLTMPKKRDFHTTSLNERKLKRFNTCSNIVPKENSIKKTYFEATHPNINEDEELLTFEERCSSESNNEIGTNKSRRHQNKSPKHKKKLNRSLTDGLLFVGSDASTSSGNKEMSITFNENSEIELSQLRRIARSCSERNATCSDEQESKGFLRKFSRRVFGQNCRQGHRRFLDIDVHQDELLNPSQEIASNSEQLDCVTVDVVGVI